MVVQADASESRHRHGEYKVPGGKLVVVDLEVAGSHLADVRVSGDFFLEPDDALERIDRALSGLPVDADIASISARVKGAVGSKAILTGFSAEAVATAVRRAVTRARGWRDYDWELVHEAPQAPALHMALDEVLAQEVAAERRPPTLRVWEWGMPAVVIGSFQSLRNEVDTDEAGKLGVSVVRRVSGGGAMFVEPGGTITYSLYAPASLVAGMSYAESYSYLDDWLIGALSEDLGLNVRYQPLNDIVSARGKVGGAAQKRLSDGTVLHHVTMAYEMDPAKMTRVLRVGREKLSDKGVTSAEKRVSPICELTNLPRERVVEAMVSHFRRRYGLTDGGVTARELRAAEGLARTKFATWEWTARVP